MIMMMIGIINIKKEERKARRAKISSQIPKPP